MATLMFSSSSVLLEELLHLKTFVQRIDPIQFVLKLWKRDVYRVGQKFLPKLGQVRPHTCVEQM